MPISGRCRADLEAKAGKPLIVVDDIAPNPDIELLERQTARFAGLAKQPEAGRGAWRRLRYRLREGVCRRAGRLCAHGRFPEEAHRPSNAVASRPDRYPHHRRHRQRSDLLALCGMGGNGVKHSLAHPGLYPQYAIVDPDLMLGKPRDLTVQTGLDALSHSLESLWNKSANPVSMAHAVQAARTIIS